MILPNGTRVQISGRKFADAKHYSTMVGRKGTIINHAVTQRGYSFYAIQIDNAAVNPWSISVEDVSLLGVTTNEQALFFLKRD